MVRDVDTCGGGDYPLTAEADMAAVILVVSASLFVLVIAYLGWSTGAGRLSFLSWDLLLRCHRTS